MKRNGSIDDDHNFYDKNSYQPNFLFLENNFFFSFQVTKICVLDYKNIPKLFFFFLLKQALEKVFENRKQKQKQLSNIILGSKRGNH